MNTRLFSPLTVFSILLTLPLQAIATTLPPSNPNQSAEKPPPGPLRLAAAQSTIEHTPLALISTDLYPSSLTIQNGGVADIVRGKSIDLAANAETQILRHFHTNKSLRLIAVVVQATYRLVASNSSGTIHTPASLKGKRIATSEGSSAGYFVERFLSKTGNLSRGDYSVINNAGMCARSPCGDRTHPGMLARGTVDAVGMWEPIAELSIQALQVAGGGSQNKVAVFGDKKLYREIYSLCTLKEKLDDPERRASIVAFVRGLLKMLDMFARDSEKVVKRVSGLVNMSEDVLRAVWEDHDWAADLPGDLLDFLAEEDNYVARIDNRAAMSKEEISVLIDTSVLKEALQG